MARTHNPKHAHRSGQYQNRAKATQCPKCGRKSALTRKNLASDVVVACRWTLQGKCDYVVMEDLGHD